MLTYKSGSPARYGVYVAPRHFDLRVVGADNEPIEGKPGARYLRIPTLLLVALCPLIGGAFVLFFPFVIIGAVAVVLLQEARKLIGGVAEDGAHLAQVRWQPGAAYLNGDKEAGADGEPALTDELADLEAEVRARRDQEQ